MTRNYALCFKKALAPGSWRFARTRWLGSGWEIAFTVRASQLGFREIAKAEDGSLDRLGPWKSAIHPQAVSITILYREQRSRSRVDMLLQRLAVQMESVDAHRHFDPQHEAAIWPAEAGSFREVTEDRLRE